MRKLHFIPVAFLSFLLITGNASAQMAGPVALGVRATPDGGGFTAKFFFGDNIAIETQLNAATGFYNGPSVTLGGFLEYNVIFADPSWRIYFGPGLHFGTWDRYDDGYPQGIFGIDGIFGVEYVFKFMPIGITADVKPAINFVRDFTYFPNNFFGIGAKYYFGHKMQHPHQPPVPPQGR